MTVRGLDGIQYCQTHDGEAQGMNIRIQTLRRTHTMTQLSVVLVRINLKTRISASLSSGDFFPCVKSQHVHYSQQVENYINCSQKVAV